MLFRSDVADDVADVQVVQTRIVDVAGGGAHDVDRVMLGPHDGDVSDGDVVGQDLHDLGGLVLAVDDHLGAYARRGAQGDARLLEEEAALGGVAGECIGAVLQQERMGDG